MSQYRFSMKVKFNPRELTIVDFLQSFAQFNIQLLEMSIKNTGLTGVEVDFSLHLDNPAKASFLLKDLKKFSTSLEILRKQLS